MKTIIVSPAATAVLSGNALRTALAAITTQSATNPFLLKVEPGIYDLGTTGLVMKSFVDLEGSGESNTFLVGRGTTPTLLTADSAEVRFISVACSVNSNCTAVRNTVSPTLIHVTALAQGNNADANNPSLAIDTEDGNPLFSDVTVIATGTNTWGLLIDDLTPATQSIATFTDLTVQSQETGASTGVGIYIGDASPRFQGGSVDITTDSGTANGIFIYLTTASTTALASINDLSVIVSSNTGGDRALGVASDGPGRTVLVRNSVFYGATAFDAVPGSVTTGDVAVGIANTQLGGTVDTDTAGNGTVTLICVGAYSGSFAPLDGTCL